jgi:predicted glycoside hydrolase/deacetylase ChbG (UPF0249 family)
MQRPRDPGTGISRPHSSGTSSRPWSDRTASAGKSASRSRVAEKVALATSSGRIPLESIRTRSSSRVRSRIAAASFRSTVVAPRTPRVPIPGPIIPAESVAECCQGRDVKRLIVNADDFGRSAGVNAGVIEAHCKGIVTSATVLVLEKAAARGIREVAERAPRLSLGLHFAVTGGGRTAAAALEVPTLAPQGSFSRTREQLPARIPPEEVRRELEAQINVFQVLARKPPTHLDSHHHAALHPSIAPVFAAVARERSLPVRAANEETRGMLRAAGVRTPDRFYGGFHAQAATFETLEGLLGKLPDGSSELMCHPGKVDEALREASSYVEERELELEILCDEAIRSLVRSRGIRLVGFHEL